MIYDLPHADSVADIWTAGMRAPHSVLLRSGEAGRNQVTAWLRLVPGYRFAWLASACAADPHHCL